MTLGSLLADDWSAFLQPTGTVLLAIGLVLACAAAWALNLVGLPGNWLGVAILALYAWLGPQQSRAEIGLAAVMIAFAAALLGEVIEFAAGALGAQRAGASRRATLYAVVGSITGAIGGAVIGLPVPLIGPILAAILFGGLGAAAGAMYGEWTDGRPWRQSWTIGHAAFWGRTWGVLGKVTAGGLIVLVAFIGVVI